MAIRSSLFNASPVAAETKKLLSAFFEPSRSIPLFIIGTAALSLALQAAYDFAIEPYQFKGGYWLAIGCLTVAVSVLLVSTIRQRYAVGHISIKQEKYCEAVAVAQAFFYWSGRLGAG